MYKHFFCFFSAYVFFYPFLLKLTITIQPPSKFPEGMYVYRLNGELAPNPVGIACYFVRFLHEIPTGFGLFTLFGL